MRVLVIGGTNHIGPYLVQRLVGRGDQVTVVNRGHRNEQLPPQAECLQADIYQEGQLAAAVGDRIFDACIHMITGNALGARVVLEPLHGQIGRYLQCGSTGVFAPLQRIPGDETCPQNPPPDFGGFEGKVEADREAARLCAEYGLPLVILRPTNVGGPGNVPLETWGGRDPEYFQRIIDGLPVEIPNTGETLLQIVHADDMARSFVLALDHPDVTGDFNISASYAITLNRYVELLGEALGRKPAVEHLPMEDLWARYQDTGKVYRGGLLFLCEHMCFDLRKAREQLGYVPQYEPEESIPQTVKWMFEQGILTRR
ncbi:MAG: NAD-dependent epimerase/dehydratase family protein [Armatimonadetes bacterium]|nr:NAD-dependent epimerase/dehydratase family protein [Armatimonadota bacterium]